MGLSNGGGAKKAAGINIGKVIGTNQGIANAGSSIGRGLGVGNVGGMGQKATRTVTRPFAK